MVSRSELARELLPETDDYPLPQPRCYWPFPADAAQAAAIIDPSPQISRSFRPPFGKFEAENRTDRTPDCPQALAVNSLLTQSRKNAQDTTKGGFLMAQNAWILEVLHDMVAFAKLNDMPKSAQLLQDSTEALTVELEDELAEFSAQEARDTIIEFPKFQTESSLE